MGRDCLTEFLEELSGTKTIVVAVGHFLQKFGFLDTSVASFKKANEEVKLIEDVESDPAVETVFKGAPIMRDVQPA